MCGLHKRAPSHRNRWQWEMALYRRTYQLAIGCSMTYDVVSLRCSYAPTSTLEKTGQGFFVRSESCRRTYRDDRSTGVSAMWPVPRIAAGAGFSNARPEQLSRQLEIMTRRHIRLSAPCRGNEVLVWSMPETNSSHPTASAIPDQPRTVVPV
jgi:hypothetical protein